ncbi:hypothetical protein T439DRAFT_381211 [Meredithblackwellia eburnea MCA 4105]
MDRLPPELVDCIISHILAGLDNDDGQLDSKSPTIKTLEPLTLLCSNWSTTAQRRIAHRIVIRDAIAAHRVIHSTTNRSQYIRDLLLISSYSYSQQPSLQTLIKDGAILPTQISLLLSQLPNLHSLSLHFLPLFDKSLLNPSPIIATNLSCIRTLRLSVSASDHDLALIKAILRKTPQLTTLALHSLVPFLVPPTSASSSDSDDEKQHRPVELLHLRSLALSGPFFPLHLLTLSLVSQRTLGHIQELRLVGLPDQPSSTVPPIFNLASSNLRRLDWLLYDDDDFQLPTLLASCPRLTSLAFRPQSDIRNKQVMDMLPRGVESLWFSTVPAATRVANLFILPTSSTTPPPANLKSFKVARGPVGHGYVGRKRFLKMLCMRQKIEVVMVDDIWR